MLTMIISEREGGILIFAFCSFLSFFYNEKEVKDKKLPKGKLPNDKDHRYQS